MGLTYAYPNPCEPESSHESYSSGVLPSRISTLRLHRKQEVNGRLCIEEVGVDLELCVHAHGLDVELIMAASCYNNNPVVISLSCIYACTFTTVVPTMIVLLWFHFSDKWKYWSSVDHFTRPTSVLLYPRVLPSGISRISNICVASYESSSSIASHRFQFSPGSELLVTLEHR